MYAQGKHPSLLKLFQSLTTWIDQGATNCEDLDQRDGNTEESEQVISQADPGPRKTPEQAMEEGGAIPDSAAGEENTGKAFKTGLLVSA